MRITALLACHNRRERTLTCLDSLFAQDAPCNLGAVLVDDGSTDGTAAAVRERFPAVTVLEGDGTLYWAAAMALAEQEAETASAEYTLWLNDDVELDRDALSALLAAERDAGRPVIVVGALRDPATGTVTYSGLRRAGRHPLRYERVAPGEHPKVVDTFNGNLVLVSKAVAAVVGGIDGRFAHGAADLDYGRRAAALGTPTLLAPGTLGTCPCSTATLRAPDRPPWRGLRHELGPKGVHPHSTARYLRRHGDAFWPLYWGASYVKLAGRALMSLAGTGRRGL